MGVMCSNPTGGMSQYLNGFFLLPPLSLSLDRRLQKTHIHTYTCSEFTSEEPIQLTNSLIKIKVVGKLKSVGASNTKTINWPQSYSQSLIL